MTGNLSAEVRVVVGAREPWDITDPTVVQGETQVRVGKGRRGLWVHRASQHDPEALQRSGEFCRNTAGGLRSESIYRARSSGVRGGL